MLKTAQALVEIDIHVALPLGDAFNIVAQGFDLTAQVADFFAQFLDFRDQRQHRLGFGVFFELGQPAGHAVVLLAQFVDAFLLFGDLLARDLIVKQASRCRAGSKQTGA